MQYCTIAQVKEVAKLFGQDFRDASPDDNLEISAAIDEATSIAKDLLQTRYDIAVLESSLPLDVTTFTKIKAALIIIDRWGVASSDKTNDYITRQKWMIRHYKNMFLTGGLRDATDALITTDNRAVYTPFSTNSIAGVYES